MALRDNAQIAIVPATGRRKVRRLSWGAFKAEHAEMKPDDFERIASALEADVAYQHYAGKGAPVVYIVRR